MFKIHKCLLEKFGQTVCLSFLCLKNRPQGLVLGVTQAIHMRALYYEYIVCFYCVLSVVVTVQNYTIQSTYLQRTNINVYLLPASGLYFKSNNLSLSSAEQQLVFSLVILIFRINLFFLVNVETLDNN